MNKIHIETLGCRLNQDESEGTAFSFLNNNFSVDQETVTAKTPVSSDTILCILNTCTVTAKAEQKARRIIRLLLKIYPEAVILVTGCYAELRSEEIKAIDKNRVCTLPGTKKFVLSAISYNMNKGELSVEKNLFNIASLEAFIAKTISIPTKKEEPFTLFAPVFEKHSRSSLKIQDGCNNNCAFCTIHQARGKSVSLNVEELVRRAKKLESNGSKEIVLTGVNLSQYADLSGEKIKDFADLLSSLLENTQKVKFRISSFYPQCVTPKLCEVLKNPRIQPFFHLSVQSGSDSILKAMNRPYTAERVLNAVNLLRKSMNNPFISCDIIAGFPGETEENFEETKQMCEKAKFSWIHAFPYSIRPNTEAAVMKNQISDEIKTQRVAWLTQNAVENKIEYVNSFAEKNLSCIVENSRSLSLSALNKNISRQKVHAVTDNMLHVEFESESIIPSGTEVLVKITECLEESIKNGSELDCKAALI